MTVDPIDGREVTIDELVDLNAGMARAAKYLRMTAEEKGKRLLGRSAAKTYEEYLALYHAYRASLEAAEEIEMIVKKAKERSYE